jgi:hypothetical protein
MAKQLVLFEPPPRARPRKLMRVWDAGNDGTCNVVNFRCPHCGYNDGWTKFKGLTADKRGRPCPRCNEQAGGND